MSDSEDEFSIAGLTQESTHSSKPDQSDVNFSLLMQSAAELGKSHINEESDFGNFVTNIVESQFSNSEDDDVLVASLKAVEDNEIIPPTPAMPVLSPQVVIYFVRFFLVFFINFF